MQKKSALSALRLISNSPASLRYSSGMKNTSYRYKGARGWFFAPQRFGEHIPGVAEG